ncbi:hypothetical protein GIB67_001981 [Kingdonia uniflora]|uniref:Uncharacterized protein n=1 Tax=Kingdonia uniflora TaxID=39325 RepID=A0A7J7MAC1_9MAGN|nr:hypothetical protein GIB67_001981 [Kingdonia uniflora]
MGASFESRAMPWQATINPEDVHSGVFLALSKIRGRWGGFEALEKWVTGYLYCLAMKMNMLQSFDTEAQKERIGDITKVSIFIFLLFFGYFMLFIFCIKQKQQFIRSYARGKKSDTSAEEQVAVQKMDGTAFLKMDGTAVQKMDDMTDAYSHNNNSHKDAHERF